MHKQHKIRLTAGQHNDPSDGLCLMEAVALFVGERHGDWPACACPVLVQFGRALNDAMPDQWRTDLLLRLVPVLVSTRDPQSDSCGNISTGLEQARARILVEWCLNAAMSEQAATNNAAAPVAQDRYVTADAIDPVRYALAEATDALAFGQAQHAARHAAAVTAWIVKAASERHFAAALRDAQSLAAAEDAAARVALAIWKGAIAAYRDAAMLPTLASHAVSHLVIAQ